MSEESSSRTASVNTSHADLFFDTAAEICFLQRKQSWFDAETFRAMIDKAGLHIVFVHNCEGRRTPYTRIYYTGIARREDSLPAWAQSPMHRSTAIELHRSPTGSSTAPPESSQVIECARKQGSFSPMQRGPARSDPLGAIGMRCSLNASDACHGDYRASFSISRKLPLQKLQGEL